jgi:FkbM family methyltransferase
LGEWSLEIDKRYHCYIHIFEPVGVYFNKIKNSLSSEKIKVNQFGLAEKTFTAKINLSAEASSIFKEGGEGEDIKLINFIDYVNQNGIKKIDLLKINIEGSEFDLLEYLIKMNFVSNIVNIQVQFHDFFPDAEKRMHKIQTELGKTHALTFQYPFIWENWQLKKENTVPNH